MRRRLGLLPLLLLTIVQPIFRTMASLVMRLEDAEGWERESERGESESGRGREREREREREWSVKARWGLENERVPKIRDCDGMARS